MLSAPRPGLSACLPVQHANAFQSWKDSHQIDYGEDQDPDDVERVPEQGEAVQAAHHDVLKTSQGQLDHHENQPCQSDGHMQPVTADQREERGKECATLGRGSQRNHTLEFAKLERKKGRSQEEGHHRAKEGSEISPRVDRQGHHSTGVAGEQEKSGLHRDVPLVKQLSTGQAARARFCEHGIARKQRREHHDVAQQEDPEPKARYNALGCGTRLTDIKQFALADCIHLDCNVHGDTSTGCARSNRPTSSAGISTSSFVRNMKASNVTAVPRSPKPAIHQMCHIRAKPVITAKNAVTKPVGLFLGTSIGSYACCCTGRSCFASTRCFFAQKASISPTRGRTAKFHAGGGDAVDHSKVRPFHGSPVVSRRSSRSRIDTTSWTI